MVDKANEVHSKGDADHGTEQDHKRENKRKTDSEKDFESAAEKKPKKPRKDKGKSIESGGKSEGHEPEIDYKTTVPRQGDCDVEAGQDGEKKKKNRKRNRKSEAQKNAWLASSQTLENLRQLTEPPQETEVKVTAPIQDIPKESKRPNNDGAGREWTVSIALPSSILSQQNKHELQTMLVGQIARAMCIFGVDELVIFHEYDEFHPEPILEAETPEAMSKSLDPEFSTSAFMKLVLEYVETPQYLRKLLFSNSAQLKHMSMIPALEIPHHLKMNEIPRFREGVVVPSGYKFGDAVDEKAYQGKSSKLVDLGFKHPFRLTKSMPIRSRVTVDFGKDIADQLQSMPSNKFNNLVVNPVSRQMPGEELGVYWGYSVRVVKNLSAVLDSKALDGEEPYDVIIGTSEHGKKIYEDKDFSLLPFKHLLVVFGGAKGLEHALLSDASLVKKGIPEDKVGDLFHHYLNLIPRTGTRTISTEEAVPICLAVLEPYVRAANR